MAKTFLVGYGKMGQRIHQLSVSQEVEIVGHTDKESKVLSDNSGYAESDLIIEFTRPEAALGNVKQALMDGKAIVCGTTGWEEHLDAFKKMVTEHGGRFFYASNFSIGANLMFQMNELLAQWMDHHPSYLAQMEEVHHTQKLDKPSGTAKTLANGIIDHHSRYKTWALDEKPSKEIVSISCIREEDVKGIHEVKYVNSIDEISIRHEAYSRDGFALGALAAAQWLSKQEPGCYGMKDLLALNQ